MSDTEIKVPGNKYDIYITYEYEYDGNFFHIDLCNSGTNRPVASFPVYNASDIISDLMEYRDSVSVHEESHPAFLDYGDEFQFGRPDEGEDETSEERSEFSIVRMRESKCRVTMKHVTRNVKSKWDSLNDRMVVVSDRINDFGSVTHSTIVLYDDLRDAIIKLHEEGTGIEGV